MDINRRGLILLVSLPLLAAGAVFVARSETSPKGAAVKASDPSTPVAAHDRVIKTDEEWKKILTPAQYAVARRGGTERAFTGPNWDNHAKGTYVCVCCDLPLFSSDTKYDSGTGWPSFWQPIGRDAVKEVGSRGIFSGGIEIQCRRCDAHLGHVFEDGPKPTGLRYCMNGTAMTFIPAK